MSAQLARSEWQSLQLRVERDINMEEFIFFQEYTDNEPLIAVLTKAFVFCFMFIYSSCLT
jgi:hypothetical protein